MATAKALMAKLRQKREELEDGRWEGEIAGRVLVAEIGLIREILADMQQVSNTNFGEEEIA